MELGRPTLLLVFGAGASKDSIAVLPDGELSVLARPPLTDDLLASRPHLQEFMFGRGAAKSLAASVVPKLGGDTGLSFEEVLTLEYEDAADNPTLRRAFTSLRFYIRDLFRACTDRWPLQVGGVTNYQWLVRAVERWRFRANGYVVWVTFNYDGLLDQALEDIYRHHLGAGGTQDPQLAGYTSHPDWTLIKLHGSYDWRRLTGVSLGEGDLANDPDATYRRLEEFWNAEAELPSKETVYERGLWSSDANENRRLWIPAVMAPLAQKSSFECPAPHLEHLSARLPSVDLIFTFGWRAQESHFLRMLNPMRLNPPDVIALSGHGEETSGPIAQTVGQASGRTNLPGETTTIGQQRIGDTRAGFSALARDRSDFATYLGASIEIARNRREPQAQLLAQQASAKPQLIDDG